jgi:hypothetical protein
MAESWQIALQLKEIFPSLAIIPNSLLARRPGFD